MDINIQNAKIELIQWLTTLEDQSLIQRLLEFRKNESKDWWNEISNSERLSIEKGISDSENGLIKPHSEAKKVY